MHETFFREDLTSHELSEDLFTLQSSRRVNVRSKKGSSICFARQGSAPNTHCAGNISS